MTNSYVPHTLCTEAERGPTLFAFAIRLSSIELEKNTLSSFIGGVGKFSTGEAVVNSRLPFAF